MRSDGALQESAASFDAQPHCLGKKSCYSWDDRVHICGL
jgi:hypothetical protein